MKNPIKNKLNDARHEFKNKRYAVSKMKFKQINDNYKVNIMNKIQIIIMCKLCDLIFERHELKTIKNQENGIKSKRKNSLIQG